jgi:SAM-dependent methyltransferase
MLSTGEIRMPMPPPVPPADLMFRVTGQADPDAFEQSGRDTVEDYAAALAPLGASWSSFRSILDFGAGSGRILRHLAPLVPGATLTVSDIDHEALSWLAAAMPGVRIAGNRALPPLACDSGRFDLIYAHSVFSHLPEAMQDAWLAELARVLAPGGVLLASVHGPGNWERHTRPLLERGGVDVASLSTRLYDDGYLYYTGDGWEHHGLPDYYHTAWHTPTYLLTRWSRWFEVVDIRAGGARPTQDLVVLRGR